MEQIIPCRYTSFDWTGFGYQYTCSVNSETINCDKILKFDANDPLGHSNNNVLGISFRKCNVSCIPQGLTKIFPNLKYLEILTSNLTQISRESLKEYKNFTVLALAENNLAFLPGDLFADFENLELLIFRDCKIEKIEPNIFDTMKRLKYVNLSNNICINKWYNSFDGSKTKTSLEEIKKELRVKFPNYIKRQSDQMREFSEQDKRIASLQQQLQDMTTKFAQFKTIMEDENLKDITIKTEKAEFKVHKFVLAACSPILAEKIKEDVHAEYLNLINVSSELFQVIINFIYTDKLPNEDECNFLDLLKACDRLKIEKLKNFTALKLMEKINSENALEILFISNIFDCEELKKKSFEEIKKIFDIESVDENLASQPEKIKQLIEIQMEKKRLEEKFKAVLNMK